jgi:hypothetical protein
MSALLLIVRELPLLRDLVKIIQTVVMENCVVAALDVDW